MNNVNKIKYSPNTQTFIIIANKQMIKEAQRREQERKEKENKVIYELDKQWTLKYGSSTHINNTFVIESIDFF